MNFVFGSIFHHYFDFRFRVYGTKKEIKYLQYTDDITLTKCTCNDFNWIKTYNDMEKLLEAWKKKTNYIWQVVCC